MSDEQKIHIMNTFSMTPDGCKAAKEYLEKIGKLEEFNNNRTSVDGFSLIMFANSYYNDSINDDDEQ